MPLQFESDYIFGIHEPGGEELMLEAKRPGWIFFTEAIGHNPDDRSGVDYSSYGKRGLGVIVRLNHGYEPEGTLPHSSQYEQFARRVANFVATSRGCNIWVIGNEMNYAVERPGIHIDWSRHRSRRDGPPENADPMRRGVAVRFNILPEQSTEIRTTRGAIISPGEPITPEMYARCYRLCRDAIHRLPGHEQDQVLVGAVAPWNTQTIYSGNPNGDWVLYFRHILEELGPAQCDGFTLHSYTHGADPALISSSAKLSPPFQAYHVQFRSFTDFMNAVPDEMRHLPAYITEAGQSQPWADRNDGWIQRSYAEIDAWNRASSGPSNNPIPNQKIRAMILYRWPRIDKWYIEGKRGVEIDFELALMNNYRWREIQPMAEAAPRSSKPTESEKRANRKAEKTKDEKPANRKAQPFQVEWLADRVPERLTAGETILVPVQLRNAGTEIWHYGGGNPIRLGYHYFRSRKKLPMEEMQDLRTDLPGDVPPGEMITVPLRIVLPEKAGNYTLEIDLIQEGVGWFKEQKSPVLSRWLTVEPPVQNNQNGQSPKRDLPVPLFLDVRSSLPKSASPYARRNLNQIKFIVISHTGANPALSLDRLANVHIAAGYPGIVYDFVVDSTGQIFRTKEMESAAQPDQAWSEQGVNIGLSGNFAAAPPPLAQIDATGRLCAWLAQNLGLPPDAIRGLGELTRTENPGATFYRGPAWKEMIQRQVQLHLAALGMGAVDTGRLDELQTQLETMRTDNEALRMQIRNAEREQSQLQRFNERLQSELVVRQRELETAREEAGNLRLHISDDTLALPRDARRYRPRRSETVRYFVIHHTGVDPATPLIELADAQRREWPGILFDYVIDAQGGIHQTQPIDEVMATAESYISQAIGIAFAGNFDNAIPNNEQLHAGGQLLAWLLDRYPQVKTERIMGVNEFTSASTSPGVQWMNGKGWKDRLLAAVRRASGMVDPSDVENELRAKIDELEQQVEQSQRLSQSLQEVRSRLEQDNQQLQSDLQQRSTQPVAVYVVPQPAIRNMIEQLPRHPTLRYEKRSFSQITHIAIHHTATPPTLSPIRIAELHIAADPSRGKEAWPGIGYHYIVQADGTIEQTNPLELASFHVYRHHGHSVGVCFAGSFMNGKIPTSAQLRAGAHLVAWLMQELKVPLARVWGHKDFPENVTVCPGSEWTQGNRWRDLLFERIEQVESGVAVKLVRHYLLLWQRPFPGPMARQDLVNAVGYLARFRPAVGFSPEEAKNAEYVTILGNEAGISAATEKMLVESGCKVERIAGRDEDETARMLAEMTKAGRRFRGYEVDF